MDKLFASTEVKVIGVNSLTEEETSLLTVYDIKKGLRKYDKSLDKDKDLRVIGFVATDEIVDYDGDLVKVQNMDIKKIKKNRSFLWSHNQKAFPIGKIISVNKDGNTIIGKAQLTDEEEYPFGYQAYKLIKGGYINNVSISFMPDYSTIEYRDVKGKSVRVINDSTLLEVSAVNIGANSNALITGYKSLKEATNKAWEDGTLDGEELNIVNDMIDSLKESKSEEVGLIEKIATLEAKIKELETKDQDPEDEFYKTLLDDFEINDDPYKEIVDSLG